MTLYAVSLVLFVAPFVHPRRPLRLLHLDVLVLGAFGLYFVHFMERGPGGASLRNAVLCAFAGLVYLLVRAVQLGTGRPPLQRGEVTKVPVRWLLVAVGVLTAVRLGYPLVDDRSVIDVGRASVLGAQHILDGQDVYGADVYRHPNNHLDAYGPVTYLAYLPFTWLFAAPTFAARAAADSFDLLTLVVLYLLGRRLGGHGRGPLLGAVLAYAWTTYPITVFTSVWAYNDALVPLCIGSALLATMSGTKRGFLLGLGAAAKFVPGVLAPLFAAPDGDRRARALLVYATAFLVGVVVPVVLLWPNGGLSELLDRTLGWQLGRDSNASVWGQFDVLAPLRYVALGAAILFALAVSLVPRHKTLCQLATLGAAVVIGFELTLRHWLPSYILWFAPLLFIGFLAGPTEDADDHARGPGQRAAPATAVSSPTASPGS